MQMIEKVEINRTSDIYGKLFMAVAQQAARPWYESDAWLTSTLQVIQSVRGVGVGWDGEDATPPLTKSLNAAEMLSALLVNIPTKKRPQLDFASDGAPTFARNTNDFYLHLVVEPSPTASNEELARLSWYSVRDGEKSFEDDVSFDGRSLPPKLRELFVQT